MRVGAVLILCLSFFVSSLQAQRTQYGSIKGTVIDSASRLPLEAATVSVFSGADSSLVNYCLTNRKGEFLVRDIPVSSPCWFMISYSGSKTVVRNFVIPHDQKELSIEAVPMCKSYSSLDEVTVRGQKPPVMVKRDTMEFNAPSFKTAPNAVVEDILKQLPGVDIDKDGNITINGKKVTKITIDGKDFFGSDFKVASKNLPTDIIDKIQVVDNKSREALFNKTADGNEDKAINLTLKKGKNKGWFGRVTAGYGSDQHYESNGNANFFDGPKQLSFIGSANNTNKSASSGGDFNINNAQSSFQGGGSGINDTKAGGINFSNDFGKKIKMTGSYFYNRNNSKNVTLLQRENILPDTSFFYTSNNTSNYTNDNHNLNFDLDYKPDTLTNLHINSSTSFSKFQSSSGNAAFSNSIGGTLINSSENRLNGTSYGSNNSTDLFFGHRFKKTGRSFTIGANYNYNGQVSNNNNIGGNIYFKPGGTTGDSINQQSRSVSTNNSFSFSATWSEPLVKNLTVLLRYNYRSGNSQSNRVTHDFDTSTNRYDIPDTLYTDAFHSNNISQNPSLSFTYFKNKFRSTIGAGVQWIEQGTTTIDGSNTQIDQRYVNFFPTASIGYRFSKTGNLNLYYNGRSQQPSVQQMQPIPDNSNPLYVRLGNPSLQPSFYHSINFNAQQSNGKTFWYSGINFNLVQNQIVYATSYDSVGRQLSMPVNVNGNYGVSANLNFSRSWKNDGWQWRFSFGNFSSFNRNLTYTNNIESISRTYSLGQQIGLSATYKDWVTIMPNFNYRYNTIRYSVQSTNPISYNTKTIGADIFWNRPKRLIIENSIRYNYNSQTAPGFRNTVTMWNAAINYSIFKNRKGLLRLAVYDLLKQNLNIFHTVTQTYVDNTQVQTLQRYILLSFTYNIRGFSKN